MTLFEECKEALSADFSIVEGESEKAALSIFNSYPFENGNVSWSEIGYVDYEHIDALLSSKNINNNDVFVLVDDADILVFRTNLILLSENIYDVTALSPKLFVFNNEMILQPLFPSEMFRVGIK